MINYKEAQNIILSQAKSFGTDLVSIDDADGRVLAEDVLADRDYPPFNRSAMDGYAISWADWEKGTRKFKVQEIIYAGDSPANPLQTNSAYKIMTGTAVPSPADTVIRREDTIESETVEFTIDNVRQYQNIARKAEDLLSGSVAIKAFTRCSAPVISTLATLGKHHIQVERLPKVSLLTTGNEVKPIDAELRDVEIRNSNSYLLKSLLKKELITPTFHTHLNDNKEEIKAAVQKALESDIIILSGGVSAGDADFVPEVLESLGIQKLFHKVAIKPGKPFWFGKFKNGPTVFALPGNPFSTFVTFNLFIAPFIRKCLSIEEKFLSRSTLQGEKVKKTPLDEFFPVRFCDFERRITTTALNGSGDIRLGIDADAIAIHPSAAPDLAEGCELEYFRL